MSEDNRHIIGRLGTIDIQTSDGTWKRVGKVNNADIQFGDVDAKITSIMEAYDISGPMITPFSIEDRQAMVSEAIELLRPKTHVMSVSKREENGGVINYEIECKSIRRGIGLAYGRIRRRLGKDVTFRRSCKERRIWKAYVELRGWEVASVSWDDA